MVVMIRMMSCREIYDDRATMMYALWKIKLQVIAKVKK